MYLFELMQRRNFDNLTKNQKLLVSKIIRNKTDKVAIEHNISPEIAYFSLSRGLYGGDTEIDLNSGKFKIVNGGR